jgi:hypothetical protein
LPTLHPVNPAESYCAQKPGLALPAEGAPLLFATQLARDLALRIESKGGAVELPVKADASIGGLLLDHPAPHTAEEDLTGVLHGKWGFDNWEGPRFHLHSAQPGKWSLTPGDQSALIVGREDTLHIQGTNSLCIDRLEELAGDAKPVKLTWKSPHPESIEVVVPMKDATPGPVTLNLYQFGLEKPDTLALSAYAEAASLDRITLSAGDATALLKGTRLDEVAKATLDGIVWTPGALNRVQDFDQLLLSSGSSTASLEPGKHYQASVTLRDGRLLKTPVTVEPPRPQLTLQSKGVQDDTTPSPVHLGSADDLPVQGRLVFFLKSDVPAKFPRNQKVEVAAEDGSFQTILTLADGLMLEDAKTALGVVDPLARFGSSAFGKLRLRAISAEGVTGDWLPLGTLVRLPGFKELRCPHSAAKPCTLTGTNLFLASALAATPDFDSATEVPADFTGTQLTVPHPVTGMLYLKLRDDPETVQTLTLPVVFAPATQSATPPATQTPAVAETAAAPGTN